MRIILDAERRAILQKLRTAEKEQIVGESNRLYQELGKEYMRDLLVTIEAMETLVVDAQRVLVAAVLQAGGELTIDKRHVLEATQVRLDRELRIHHGRDLYLSVSEPEL